MMPKAKFNELSSVIDSIKMVSSTEFLVNDRGTYLTADGHGQKLRIESSLAWMASSDLSLTIEKKSRK